MAIRSNIYDVLNVTVKNLQNKMNEHFEELSNIVIMKADVHDKEVIRKSEELKENVDNLCSSVYNQFTILKRDYVSGAINLSRYKENLKPLKDLLIDREHKITNPNLHATEIALEVGRIL